MARRSYERCSWFPSGLREKTSCRGGCCCCCDLLRFCRGRAQLLDSSPDPACVHEAVKLLEELLVDGGCARAVSCGCRDSLQDSWSLAVALSSAFLPRRHEDACRPRGASRFPCRLLRGFFFSMDLLRHWHKMMNVIPWIQDLLEVCASGSVPRPQGMCLSCRGRQAVSEVSAGKTHKPSNRPAAAADRRAEEYRTTAVIFNHLSDSEKTRENEIPGAEERSVHRLRPGLLSSSPQGLLSSAQQLNSLKKDLETHQLYLGAIETRLSDLERRAQDVTKRLERANLELEAIKQESVAVKTLVDELTPSPVTELVDNLWEDSPWSLRLGLCRRKGPERRCSMDRPAGGSSVHQRDYARIGLSICQRHVDVLIRQITRQIGQMESDIKATSELRRNAR